MRIGLFGGSFDPIHNGHVGLVQRFLAEKVVDRVVVLPAAVSPFKTDARPSEDYDRLLLVRAAFMGMANVTVDPRELKRGGVSYAIDTVKEFKAEFPDDELIFMVGDDTAAELERWKDWETLRTLCRFESYPRTPEASHDIRRMLAEGESIHGLVPEAVELFLKHHVTYQPDEKIVNAVLNGLARKEGYCPCRLPKLPEFVCPCQEFRGQLADASYHGLCHCRLYLKP